MAQYSSRSTSYYSNSTIDLMQYCNTTLRHIKPQPHLHQQPLPCIWPTILHSTATLHSSPPHTHTFYLLIHNYFYAGCNLLKKNRRGNFFFLIEFNWIVNIGFLTCLTRSIEFNIGFLIIAAFKLCICRHVYVRDYIYRD